MSTLIKRAAGSKWTLTPLVGLDQRVSRRPKLRASDYRGAIMVPLAGKTSSPQWRAAHWPLH